MWFIRTVLHLDLAFMHRSAAKRKVGAATQGEGDLPWPGRKAWKARHDAHGVKRDVTVSQQAHPRLFCLCYQTQSASWLQSRA
jgi:hypothetical protein